MLLERRWKPSAICASLTEKYSQILVSGRPVHVARAPARIDLMGGIADYSGSLVLEGTLAEATICGIQLRTDRQVGITSSSVEQLQNQEPEVIVSLDDLAPVGGIDPYVRLRETLSRDVSRRWSAYGLGCLTVLLAEGEIDSFPCGATIVVTSDTPLGAGVSSSAAFEVAVMRALASAYGLEIDGMRLAALCQKVENFVVGAPCGIMDQVTSNLGRSGKLLALRCQPHTLEGFVDLPSGLRIVGFDTRVKHNVGGSRYTTSRIGAFMGQKMIADAKAMGGEPDTTNGYLANIGVSEFRARWNKYLPASMKGAEFLARYGGTNDPVTTVDPDETYMVRSRVEHPVYENARVRGFSALLEDARLNDVVEPLVRAGALMYSSHWSYGKRCGMGSKETDLVVRLVRRLGPERGFLGAKITGGGSGGTVAILCKSDTDAEVNLLAEAYTAQTGLYPHLFLATGPGAEEWGITVFTP